MKVKLTHRGFDINDNPEITHSEITSDEYFELTTQNPDHPMFNRESIVYELCTNDGQVCGELEHPLDFGMPKEIVYDPFPFQQRFDDEL